jgi:PAS domain S-box-containing protein
MAAGTGEHVAWPADVALLDAISAAVIATDLDGRIFYWNAAAERLYGYAPGDLLGAHAGELLVSPDDRDYGAEIMASVLAGTPWTGEFRVRTAVGGTIPVRITDSPLIRDGEVVGVIGVAEDLSAGTYARRDADLLATRLSRLARVTAELSAAETVEQVTDIVVAQAADAAEADVASLCLFDGDWLRMIGVRGVKAGVEDRWSRFPADSPVPVAVAAVEGRRIVLVGRAEMETYPAMAAELDREQSFVALPLAVDDRRLGAIGLAFSDVRSFDEQELEFLGTLADSCAHALQRLEATEAARRTAAQLRFLASASAELASSLDYEATLANVARLAVPELADWCAVQVLQDGQLRTLAAAHVNPEKVAAALELQARYPVDMRAANGAP